jgi:hypothetical protein
MAIQIRKARPIIKNVTSTNNILFITPFRAGRNIGWGGTFRGND